MKLSIPSQNPATEASSPSNPDKLKKLLSDIPKSNVGELTKQTYSILKDQNRQEMPVSDRLENLEMLRKLSRGILENLKKYFINRTLPLPEKSKKIIYINQSILQELAYGYEIIAQNYFDQENPEQHTSNETSKTIDDDTLGTVIFRAINYLSEILLRSSEVYQPTPNNLWHNAHQLYHLAETKQITEHFVLDIESEKEVTITNSYKRLLLFALALPNTLRQSDCERIYKKLLEWTKLTHIKQQAPESLVDCVFSMRLFENKPPHHLNQKDISDGAVLRILDSCKLIAHIEELIAEKTHQSQKLSVGDEIPLETLMALVNTWGHNKERRFSRTERSGHINVAIGLSKISKAIAESKKLEDTLPKINKNLHKTPPISNSNIIDAEHAFFNVYLDSEDDEPLSLESIPEDEEQNKHLAIGDDTENQWDMVARGRVITDAYEKEKQLIDTDQLAKKQNKPDAHWQIVNVSPGGYCLRWNSDDTSSAQIGELIALQEFDANNDFNWHVGVIRWMQYTRKSGLEIGVQVLSPKVEIATAQRENRPDEMPFDCLMMPTIKALNQNASAILPSHAFNTNSKLTIKCKGKIISITLGKSKEVTGSFTQFYFDSTSIDKSINEKLELEEEKHDSFNEIWSSL